MFAFQCILNENLIIKFNNILCNIDSGDDHSMSASSNKYFEDIKFLRIVWCDNGNLIRSKALRIDPDDEDELYIGISRAQQAVPAVFDGVAHNSMLDPVGEVYIKADPSTILPLPYSKGHARAFGDMYYKGKHWECCPRNYLKRMVEVGKKYDLDLKVSFECEFYLLNPETRLPEILDENPFASVYSMDYNHEVIDHIVEALEAQNIEVEQYYPESGPGQHEITVKYTEPLKACDNQIIFRETVHAVALKYGLIASFLPKLFPDRSGNGCHLHMSLWKDGENITEDPEEVYGLSDEAGFFIAGILDNLPSLMAVTTPTTNSFKRILPHSWVGRYNCWGFDNREASIRVVTEMNGGIQHFELKTIDASSNPYLALGSVIRAGVDGFERKLELPDPVQSDPANLNAEERFSKGVKELPSSLTYAIGNFESNTLFMDSFGEGFAKAYIAVKKAELEYLKHFTIEEEVELMLRKY